MKPNTQLTYAEQDQIYALMQNQQTQKAIAQVTGVHKSTISGKEHPNQGQRGPI